MKFESQKQWGEASGTETVYLFVCLSVYIYSSNNSRNWQVFVFPVARKQFVLPDDNFIARDNWDISQIFLVFPNLWTTSAKVWP